MAMQQPDELLPPESKLQVCRRRARALSLAAEKFDVLRAALLPYPSFNNIDFLSQFFQVKRKVFFNFNIYSNTLR